MSRVYAFYRSAIVEVVIGIVKWAFVIGEVQLAKFKF